MKRSLSYPARDIAPAKSAPGRILPGRLRLGSKPEWRPVGLFLAFSAARISAQSAANALPPLAGPYGELPPTFWDQYGTLVIIGGCVLAAMLIAAVWVMLRPKPPVILPPEFVAWQALTKLRAVPEDGKVLSEVGSVLRHYIIRAFEFPAGEYTTTEFSAALAGNERVGSQLSECVSHFLQECDQRKFSPVQAEAPLDAANRALAMISDLEKQRAKSTAETKVAQP